MNWNELQPIYTAWALKTFTQATISSKFAHLRSELEEAEKNPEDIEEWADIMLLYMGAAHLAGHTMDEILEAALKKFEKNKKRKWGKPNEQGFVEHIKDV